MNKPENLQLGSWKLIVHLQTVLATLEGVHFNDPSKYLVIIIDD